MPRFLKWAAAGLAAVLALVLLLGIALKVVFDTEAGTLWAIERANTALPGSIDASDFDGTLWRGLNFSRLSYHDPNRELEATNLQLKVDWATLAAGRLTLETVAADVVRYRNLAAPPASPIPFELSIPTLPVNISIDAIDIPMLEYATQQRSLEVRNTIARNADIDGQSARVRALSAVFADTAISATRIRATLAGEVPISADVAWERLDDSWSGSGSIAESLANLRFEQSVAGPYPAHISGTVQLLHKVAPEFDAIANWDRWTFGDVELSSGAVRLRGVAENYLADYGVTAELLDDRTLQVSGTARGDTEQLFSFAADVQSPEANAELAGSLAWAPAFFVEAQLHASEIDPGAFVAALSGRLSADASVSIAADNSVAITNLSVSGLLNNQPAKAAGNLVWAAEKLQCRDCEIQVGSNVLRVGGESAGERIELTLQIDAPQLAELWPGISGAATISGSLGGTRSSPQFSGNLSARQFGYDEWSVSEVRIHSSETDLETLNMSASLGSIRRGSANLGSLEISGEGQWQQLLVRANWAIDGAVIRADGIVRREDSTINGTINNAQVTEANSGDWRLSQPFDFNVAGNDVSVTAHDWTGDSGSIQVRRFATGADEVSLAATIVDLPLQLANPWLPENLTLLGSASADVDLTQRAGKWVGSINWRQSNTVLQVTEIDDQLTNVSVSRAELQAELRDGGMVARAWMSIDPGIDGQLDLELSRFTRDAPLRARLALQGEQWDWVSAVFPEVDAFKGTISADVTADGPLNAPEFAGNVSWRDGGLLVPAMNVPLNKIEIVISGASNGTAVLTGTAKAGDGKLAIDGRFVNLTQPTRSVQLALSGDAAALIDWPEYQLWATPDLTITGNAEGWQFGGQIEVTRANFVIPEIPEGAVRVSEDVTILGDQEPVNRATRVSGEARLTLGRQVHVAALGLDTFLQGNLLVRMRADRATTAEGRVTLVDGVFAAYGQKLTISEGTLTFTGPLDDPLVDVKAVRVIETFDGTVTAGIHLRGRAQNLTSTVFSEPSMADADALSYLVIGRPLNQATESEGGELSGAAVALGLRQATRLTEQIGQTVGLDQLSLTGDGGDATALVAGKQLNSRLYARYAYGVFSRLGTLLVRYKLSRTLSLEAGAGENQSIDVLYSVEKE